MSKKMRKDGRDQNFNREEFIKKANREYARLKNDSIAWKEMQKELEEWDITLLDGLVPYLDIY
jgi:hypothetical protein